MKNPQFRLEEGYICKQDIYAYRWAKIFVTFLSFRVIKKNPSKIHTIKFCLWTKQKDLKIFGDKENKSVSEYKTEYKISFCNTENDIQFIK